MNEKQINDTKDEYRRELVRFVLLVLSAQDAFVKSIPADVLRAGAEQIADDIIAKRTMEANNEKSE